MPVNRFCPKSRELGRYTFEKRLFHKKTKYQTIDVFQHKKYGVMMFIDDDAQISSSDSYFYDKALVDPLFKSGPVKNILIMGGGDCGVLRELLTHKEVKKAVMVDIDKDFVEASKKFIPDVVGNSLKNKRSKVIIGNAFEFIKNKSKFDAIIYDLTMDPVGAPKDFFDPIAKSLSHGGKLAMQVSCIHDTSMKKKVEKELSKHFKRIKFYEIMIPSYEEKWVFVYAEKK
jgi:spermidine synthase